MATTSAKKSEKYNRIAARTITTLVLVSMLLTGCATRPKVKFTDAFDEQAIAAEITASGPLTIDGDDQVTNGKMIRRSAMAAQAGILRAIYGTGLKSEFSQPCNPLADR